MRCNTAVIPILFAVNEQFATGNAAPAIERIVAIERAAVIIILHASESVDFGDISAVTEGVG